MRDAHRIKRYGLMLTTIVAVWLMVGAVLVQAQDPTPRPLYALPDPRANLAYTSNSFAFSDTFGVLVVTNFLTDSVSLVAPNAATLRQELRVEDDPRTATVTMDGLLALVTNRGSGSLSIIDLQNETVAENVPLDGVWPYSVVTNNNQTAYLTMQGSAEVLIFDIPSRTVTAHIPTPDFPTGMALWGDFLYITHLWSGDVSLIYLPQQRVVSTVSTGRDTGMSPSIDLDTSTGRAYLPQTRSRADNPTLTYDTLVAPVVNVLRLDGLAMQRAERLTLDTLDRPVNMPFAIEIDAFRRWIYVANAGSNSLTVLEMDTGNFVSHIPVGANPRGLMLNGDRSQLYVHNAIDGTISVVDTTAQRVVDNIPINIELVDISVDTLIGAELFHTADDARLAQSNWVSCANCHFDGMSDGQVWLGLSQGPRNTPTLYDLPQTAPYGWSGTWDELADVELKIRSLQGGTGLIDGSPFPMDGEPHTGMSLDLDTLVIYLSEFSGPSSGADVEQVARGMQVFEELACASCHTMPIGTDLAAYDVGTGGTYDTPTLRWLWLTAPYFHDGSAATLADVFAIEGDHQLSMTTSPDDIDALIAYLLTLPTE